MVTVKCCQLYAQLYLLTDCNHCSDLCSCMQVSGIQRQLPLLYNYSQLLPKPLDLGGHHEFRIVKQPGTVLCLGRLHAFGHSSCCVFPACSFPFFIFLGIELHPWNANSRNCEKSMIHGHKLSTLCAVFKPCMLTGSELPLLSRTTGGWNLLALRQGKSRMSWRSMGVVLCPGQKEVLVFLPLLQSHMLSRQLCSTGHFCL